MLEQGGRLVCTVSSAGLAGNEAQPRSRETYSPYPMSCNNHPKKVPWNCAREIADATLQGCGVGSSLYQQGWPHPFPRAVPTVPCPPHTTFCPPSTVHYRSPPCWPHIPAADLGISHVPSSPIPESLQTSFMTRLQHSWAGTGVLHQPKECLGLCFQLPR